MENSLPEISLADSWGGVALLFLLFCGFFGAVLGYSFRLRSAFPGKSSFLVRLSDSFLLASFLLYAGAFSLSALHALRLFPRWSVWLALLPGLYFLRPCAKELWRVGFPGRRFAALAAIFVLALRALSAALPSQHGDPLLYHLLGPRLWVEAGGFVMHPNLPNALLASSWECLYVWPQLLWFSRTPLFGLVEAQLFSQWLHLLLAWTGCGLLAMRLFRGSVRDSWLPLAGLAALFISGVQWTAPLAKNDVGIAFWSLGAIVLFLEMLQEKEYWKGLAAGIFVGLAVSGKVTAVLSVGPVLLLLLVVLRPKKVDSWILAALGWVAVGAVLGAVPIYLRNFLLSKNPFFPLFPQVFPSPWISKSWGAHFAQVHPSNPLHAFPRLFSRFPELLKETHWAFGVVLLLLFRLTGKKHFEKHLGSLGRRPQLALFSGSLLAYAVFVITQAPEIELRYLGASLMILSSGGICFLLRFAEKLPSERFRQAAAALVLVVALTTSRLPLHIVRKIWQSPLGVEFLKTHSAGEAKAWIRAHSGKEFTILAGDNETYYLTPVGVAVLTERPDLDAANGKLVFPEFLAKLCELSHARFLLDARPEIGVEARFGAAALAPGKIFEAQRAKIYDLRRLGCP